VPPDARPPRDRSTAGARGPVWRISPAARFRCRASAILLYAAVCSRELSHGGFCAACASGRDIGTDPPPQGRGPRRGVHTPQSPRPSRPSPVAPPQSPRRPRPPRTRRAARVRCGFVGARAIGSASGVRRADRARAGVAALDATWRPRVSRDWAARCRAVMPSRSPQARKITRIRRDRGTSKRRSRGRRGSARGALDCVGGCAVVGLDAGEATLTRRGGARIVPDGARAGSRTGPRTGPSTGPSFWAALARCGTRGTNDGPQPGRAPGWALRRARPAVPGADRVTLRQEPQIRDLSFVLYRPTHLRLPSLPFKARSSIR
jgi:hypothetical protein